MRHWSLIAQARWLLFAGLTAVVAAILISTVGTWNATNGYLRADAERQLVLANTDYLVGMVNQQAGLRGYIDTADPLFLAPVTLGRRQVTTSVRELTATVKDPELLGELAASRQAADAWVTWADRQITGVQQTGAPLPDIATARVGKVLFETFRGTNDQVQATVLARVGQSIGGARTSAQIAFTGLLVAGLVAVLVLGALELTFIRRMLRPVAGLAATARELAANRSARILGTDRQDEVGILARALAAWQATARDRDRIFTLSADMFAIVGFDGIFKTVNPSWERVTGWSPAELTSKQSMDFIHPDDRAATITAATSLADGATLSFRNRFHLRDGTYRWLDWTSVPVHDERLIYSVARDITDQQKAEDAIRALNTELELNKDLEAFSYSVSHDLRAPLRAIHGFVRIILDDYGAEFQGEARRYLDLVAANAQQMGRLVDDLLRFSRLGRQALNMQRVNVSTIVQGALEQLQPDLEGRAVELTVGELPSLDGDPALLQQVFLNLVGNAIKYTKGRQPAHIEVGARTEPNLEVVYFVKDDGAGFDMRYAHKLFGVFQRLHRSDEYEGTGVGLALVQRIITKHGGRIWAEAAVDAGATFFFTLGGAPAWKLKAAA